MIKENGLEKNLYTEERPWGYFSILEETDNYKVKKLVIYPHKRLSLQLHKHRSEQWVVVEGNPTLTCNDIIKDYIKGESIFIPVEAIHRIENKQSENAILIEVQTGTYLGEDDIIRIEDDFNRV